MKYETQSKNCYCVWCSGWTAPRPPNHRKDQGLFSEITLECLTRPGMDRHTKKEPLQPHIQSHGTDQARYLCWYLRRMFGLAGYEA